MATTHIAAVRTAVATVLSDAGHTVYKYGVDVDHAGRTWTVIGRVRAEQTRIAMSDAREERITVQLVTVHQEGGRSDTRAASGEATVLAVAAAVESDLRADPTLGGVALHSEPSTSTEVEFAADDNGWLARVNQTVEVLVHI